MYFLEVPSKFCVIISEFNFQDKEEPTKWRVENSWGDENAGKGYLLMTSEWFKEYVFEVVVDKSIVPKEVMDVFSQDPVILPAWDPMGTLAEVSAN